MSLKAQGSVYQRPIRRAVYASPQMRAVFEQATRVGQRDSKVLITGESGVGKDVLATHIHESSARAHRPLVAVNCAGLTESLLESELFGHVKGSFTGAYRDKPGKLQLAHGGTIFLDEVGEMTLRMQALLLRFFESGEVQPVGGDTTQRVDARVITATNRNLTKMAAEGAFRQDLLYRIRVVHLHIPPLRERAADIRPLLEHFIDRLGPSVELTPAALQALETYHWPGNVRELQNVVEQLAAIGHPGPIDVHDLPLRPQPQAPEQPQAFRDRRRRKSDEIFDAVRQGTSSFWPAVYERFINRDLTRDDVRQLIGRGLEASGGNYGDLLRLFHMPQTDYKRLLNFLKRHDCTVDFRQFRRRPEQRATGGDADAAGPVGRG